MGSSTKEIREILIIKPSSLGDVVLALPALGALRRSFPEAKISWLIRSEFAPLLKEHPYLDDIIIFDRKYLGKAWYNPNAFSALVRLIQMLRNSKYDVVIDLQGLFRTASLGWLSGCKRRFGFSKAREFAEIFYTCKIERDENSTHVVDYYLKVVEAVGAGDTAVEFVLPTDAESVDSVKKKLTERKIEGNNYAVFVPGSFHRSKCWPAERFGELAERITSQFGLPVVAVGTSSESDIVEEIQSRADVSIVNLAGGTGLNELVELLRGARLVVSNDTGPGHIAAALGVPLVMMFSWSNPARILPYGRSECMVAKEPYDRGHKIKSSDPKHDITAISVDDVYQKVCEQLA